MSCNRIKINNEILKVLREISGYTEEEMAKKLRISLENYLSIEKGEKGVTIKQLDRLAEILMCPSAVFFLEKIPENYIAIKKLLKSEEGDLDDKHNTKIYMPSMWKSSCKGCKCSSKIHR